MLDKLIIVPIAFAMLVFAGLLLLPYLVWLAWGLILLLKKEKKGQDLELRESVK